jgi:phage baseplate assembly protein W
MISAILPLQVGTSGFASFTDEQKSEAIKQNFKFLLLTRPGEYAMNFQFGVGLPNYLFSSNTEFPEDEVESRIYSQASEYMPYITINSVEFQTDEIDSNGLGLSINYSISNSAFSEVLNLQVTS